MKPYSILVIILLFATRLPAQQGVQWQPNRSAYVLTADEKAIQEYCLLMARQMDFSWESDKLNVEYTEHRIYRVVNAQAIERNNRIYIPMNNVLEIVTVKARTITEGGKVVNFDSKNLKEIKDEEYGNSYKIFAMEGVEANSEVEYFYTLKMKGRAFYTWKIQSKAPVREVFYQLTGPKKLHFEHKVYNDTATVHVDTLNRKRRYTLRLRNLQPTAQENFSSEEANRIRLETKLAFNLFSVESRLNTWADAAKTFYKSVYELDKDSQKELDAFVKTLKDKPTDPMGARIRNIEDQVKLTINILEQYGEDALEYVPAVVRNHQANGAGMTRLLVGIYNRLNIPVQVVLTCDRGEAAFDGNFQSWSYLDSYVLYFPGTGRFLSPESQALRYPLMDQKYTPNKGLFIEPIRVGTAQSAIALIKDIPALPYDVNTDDLDIEVKFDEAMEENEVHLVRTFSGYEAAFFTAYYQQMNKEQLEKLLTEVLKPTAPDLKILSWTATPSVKDEVSKFTIDARFTTAHFIETAGPRKLFKVGELIGPQSELYRDDKRRTRVENRYNRGYNRTIRIVLPAGTQVANEQGIKMDVHYTEGSSMPFLFQSDYKKSTDHLDITIHEYYKEVVAPLERYEDFRKVVNAAADFNKVKVVLGRQ